MGFATLALCLRITSDSHVAEEEPAADQGLLGTARGLIHDVQVRGVKAQGGGWEPVSHQVDPQKLYGDQGFRETQSSCEEDTARAEEKRGVRKQSRNM